MGINNLLSLRYANAFKSRMSLKIWKSENYIIIDHWNLVLKKYLRMPKVQIWRIDIALLDTSLLPVQCPLKHIVPVFTLMIDSKPANSTNVRIIALNRGVCIAHKHLPQEVDAVSCVPWRVPIGEAIHRKILLFNHCIVEDPVSMPYSVL